MPWSGAATEHKHHSLVTRQEEATEPPILVLTPTNVRGLWALGTLDGTVHVRLMVNLLLGQSHRLLIRKQLRLAEGALAVQVGTVLDFTALAQGKSGVSSDQPFRQFSRYRRSNKTLSGCPGKQEWYWIKAVKQKADLLYKARSCKSIKQPVRSRGAQVRTSQERRTQHSAIKCSQFYPNSLTKSTQGNKYSRSFI